MATSNLASLKFFSLLFLLPGLAGLIGSAVISTDYLVTLPRTPVPEEYRMTPRSIHGTVVYQTLQEDRRLTLAEDGSVCIFVIGLAISLVFLEKWGAQQTASGDEEEQVTPLKRVG